MRWILRASDRSYRQAIQDPGNEGRLPLARLTFGCVSGYGWGFVHPWEQQALFPGKGNVAGIGNPLRHHEPFWILRWRRACPATSPVSFKHPNHDYFIEGWYWYGWVWRAVWGKRWGFWPRARWKLLDPDIVTHDPGKADDWGEQPGEDW